MFPKMGVSKNGWFISWTIPLYNMDDLPVRFTGTRIAGNSHMGMSENSVPLHPMVFMIIIPIKWLFHWEYTQHFQETP